MTEIMDIVSLPTEQLLSVESLDYSNSYNYKTPHRHNYFEIILVNEGEGHQFIDFQKYSLSKGSIYLVYPEQVHLLRRNQANGLLLQFKKDIFEFIFPIRHYDLFFKQAELKLKLKDFELLHQLFKQIEILNLNQDSTHLSFCKIYSYLEIILITLIENQSTGVFFDQVNFSAKFILAVGENIKTKRKVVEYAELLSLPKDKLTAICKKTFGKTPLKIIHEELLLEIKREMILNEASLKEISYDFNFNNPANFSKFIKSNTGKSASELKAELLTLYNL